MKRQSLFPLSVQKEKRSPASTRLNRQHAGSGTNFAYDGCGALGYSARGARALSPQVLIEESALRF